MPSKTNRIFFRFSLVILIFISGIIVFYFWNQFNIIRHHRQDAASDFEDTYTHYSGFGIWIPDDYEVHGIDVSRYQYRINWKLVKQMTDGGLHLSFAFIKATEGTDLKDDQFERNWRKAKENQIIRGAYHFFNQNAGGHEQALFFIRNVELLPGDLPPVLDIEKYSGTEQVSFLNEVAVWLRVVEDHYKVRPIIYSNAGFYNQFLAQRFSDYPLWVAHYQNKIQPAVSGHWHFWQHNEGGRVNGIKARVDFNVFNGSPAEFNQLLLK